MKEQESSRLVESSERPADQLIELITPLVETLGYEIVHLEAITQRQKVLRLYIDHLGPDSSAVGVEDCVRVTRALDEPLDQMELVEKIFHGAYELEVSSPGVNRPLRQMKDFEKFSGHEVRLHVFRPLTAEEIENEDYFQRNPRQKHFLGILKGIRAGKVLLEVPPEMSGKGQRKNKPKASSQKKQGDAEIAIPFPMISKANLEPKFEFDGEEKEISL